MIAVAVIAVAAFFGIVLQHGDRKQDIPSIGIRLGASHILDGPLGRMGVNPDAYDEYLRGRHLAEKGDLTHLKDAQDAFERAVSIQPDFADAWVALGNVYRFRASRGQMDQQPGWKLARQAAENALAVDPEQPGAYVLSGHIARSLDWDWQTAGGHFAKAVCCAVSIGLIMFVCAYSVAGLTM